MRVGLVLKDPSCRFVERVAPAAEDRGFTHLLFTELSIPDAERITGHDPFVSASIALHVTTSLRVGTGVAGTVFHSARHLALRAATLQEQSGGRFVLGCGVSHKGFADMVGVTYPSSPIAHARHYCDELRAVGQRLAFGAGFPVWLAALGDRMAAIGATHADGLILNWVSPDRTRRTIEFARGQSGRRVTAAVFLRVGREGLLRSAAERYLLLFANYGRHFTRQGLTTPEEVVRETCAPTGDPVVLGERIAAYRNAGADVVCVYPADADEEETFALVNQTMTS